MRIDLQFPYSQDWRLGYLVINKEPRRNVILYNSHKDRSTVSYARYLMSVHLGRYLTSEEVVDHINNDRMDDRIENYQILSLAENTRKSVRPKKISIKTCPVCSKEFEFEERNRNVRSNPTCSRKCGGIKSHWK